MICFISIFFLAFNFLENVPHLKFVSVNKEILHLVFFLEIWIFFLDFVVYFNGVELIEVVQKLFFGDALICKNLKYTFKL